MPRLAEAYDKDNNIASVICTNRKYMGGKILSSVSKCKGCKWEECDLFSGTGGKQIWQWYCSFIPSS